MSGRYGMMLGLSLLLALLPWQAGAEGSSSENIGRLMRLMAFDEVMQQTLEVARQDPAVNQIPEPARGCLLEMITGDQLRNEMRLSYLEVFPTVQMQEDAIVFLESATGRKLIRTVVDSMDGSDTLSGMTTAPKSAMPRMTREDELQAERFSKTEAGIAFINAKQVLEKRKAEITPILIRQCVSTHSSKS